MASLSESVNKIAVTISGLTNDAAERFAIACTLVEIYKFEIEKNLVSAPSTQNANQEK